MYLWRRPAWDPCGYQFHGYFNTIQPTKSLILKQSFHTWQASLLGPADLSHGSEQHASKAADRPLGHRKVCVRQRRTRTRGAVGSLWGFWTRIFHHSAPNLYWNREGEITHNFPHCWVVKIKKTEKKVACSSLWQALNHQSHIYLSCKQNLNSHPTPPPHTHTLSPKIPKWTSL